MSEENQEPITATPPPANMISPKQKNKRSLKGMLAMISLLLIAGFIFWLMFLSGGGNQNQRIDTPTQGAGGGAEITGSLTEGGSGGGLRQERAQNQSDIAEEEQRLQAINAGRGTIQLGVTDLISDDTDANEPTEPPDNPTFGAIGPEPSAESSGPQARNTITPPGRRTVSMNQPSTGAGNSGNAALLAEMERLSEGENHGWNNRVEYADTTGQAQGDGQLNTGRMPITPGLEDRYYGQQGQGSSQGRSLEAGDLAMPGETLIAYMENRISSDQPSGRVVAEILDGPLAGAKALGIASFEGERLIINFDRVVTKDGDYLQNVSLFAVDPHTLDTSLQTGVNHRRFLRYGVPLLYGITGLGIEYAAQRGTQTVTEVDVETGRVTRRSVDDTESFGEFAGQRVARNINQPLSEAANRAASAKPIAWAEPGIIGLAVDTPIPAR